MAIRLRLRSSANRPVQSTSATVLSGRAAQGLALILSCTLAGCAVNPVSQRPEFVLTTEAREQSLGDNAQQQIADTIGFADAPSVAAYVETLGARLAAHSPRKDIDYKFYVLDMKEPNAMSLPGGHIFVSRGLLAFLNSEDELANVLGHEIAHVAARHSVQRRTRAAPLAFVTGIGAFTTGLVLPRVGRVVAGIGEIAGGAFLAPYSRSQENEADEVGQIMAAAAGWDPNAMATMLQALEREQLLRTNQTRQPSFYDSHPTNRSRASKTARRASELSVGPQRPVAADHRAFLDGLSGLTYGVGAKAGVVEDGLFLHPDLGLALRFPEHWLVKNTPTVVAAKPGAGGAIVMFSQAAEGNDPEAGARVFAKQSKAVLSTEATTIDGLPALHAIVEPEGSGRPVNVDATWIAHRGVIYQILGVSERVEFSEYESTFRAIAESFHRPSAAELSQVTESRIRIVEAHAGETAVEIAARTGSKWRATTIAAANGVEFHHKFGEGEPIKIAVEEPYAN